MDVGRFNPGEARTTSLFHMNGLIHCVADDSFDLYVARSFGQSFFEVITHAAAELRISGVKSIIGCERVCGPERGCKPGIEACSQGI